MKNIHLIPTNKLSRLGRFIDTNNLFLRITNDIPRGEDIDIYITSDEEIKEGDWYIHLGKINKRYRKNPNAEYPYHSYQKIILTTDQDLITDGVQAIDDEFLEWFVENPSCEVVKVIYWEGYSDIGLLNYEIIIPQEEPKQDYKLNSCDIIFETAALIENKQETLEKAAEKWCEKHGCGYGGIISIAFETGAKWQAERMYSDEEVIDLLQEMNDWPTTFEGRIDIKEWFNKFKKK